MKTILLNPYNDDELQYAGELIRKGKLVAFPTETVYGLGANALDEDAAKKVYSAKGRPSDNPLIVHLSKVDDADKYCKTTDMFYKIAEKFMPGPVTVVLKKKSIIPDTITANQDTVAIRIPSDKTARKFIEYSGCPIAAPSANISGKPSPTSAKHVINDMDGKIDAVIVGEDSEIGLESTIILPEEDKITILRPGGITVDDIKSVCENVVLSKAITEKYESSSGPIAPGMKYKHYAPKENVYIIDSCDSKFYDFVNKKKNCGVLCFDEDFHYIDSIYKLSIGKRSDKNEQAHKLFSMLREFDAMDEIDTVYARMPSKDGIGLAVFNRLIKAAGFNIIVL